MRFPLRQAALAAAMFVLGGLAVVVFSQERQPGKDKKPPPFDAVAEAQTPRDVPATRPEQKKSEHDRSEKFDPDNAPLSSPALKGQPGEGKSTVIANLATALAKGGARVLLADLDLRRPVQHRGFGVRRSPGYSDLIAQGADTERLASVVQRAHVLRGVEWGIAQVNHGKRAGVQRMQPGDGFVYYSPKTDYPEGDPLREFTAIGIVADGDAYQAAADPNVMAGLRPWRRAVRYSTRARPAPIAPLLPVLDLTRGNANWGYQLRRGHLGISKHDFDLIAQEMGADELVA